MAVTVDLSDNEATFVMDLLEWWEGGFKEAKELTTKDITIDGFDQLLDLMSGYDDQERMVASLKDKLSGRIAA